MTKFYSFINTLELDDDFNDHFKHALRYDTSKPFKGKMLGKDILCVYEVMAEDYSDRCLLVYDPKTEKLLAEVYVNMGGEPRELLTMTASSNVIYDWLLR